MKIDKVELVKTILGSKLKLKILKFLNSNSIPTSEREIARICGVSHTAINKLMSQLSSYGLIKPTKIGNAIWWALDKNSLSFLYIMKFIEDELINPVDIISYEIKRDLTFLNMLYKKFNKDKEIQMEVYIIGSIAEGLSKEESDIDLLVITGQKNKKFLQTTIGTATLSSRITMLTGNQVSINIFTLEEIRKRPELHWVDNSINKGIKVYP